MINSPELPEWQEKYKTHLSILEEIKENQDLLQFDNRYIKILFDKKKEEKIRERHQEGKLVESLRLQKLNLILRDKCTVQEFRFELYWIF